MILALLATAALQVNNTPPTATLVTPKTVVAQKPVKVVLKLQFADGLHGYQNPPSDQYQIPVTVKLKSGNAKIVSIAYPKGTDMKMVGDEKPTKVYTGTVQIPVTLKAGAKSGPIVLTISYQQCTEANCFPPSTVEAKATLQVSARKK